MIVYIGTLYVYIIEKSFERLFIMKSAEISMLLNLKLQNSPLNYRVVQFGQSSSKNFGKCYN